MKLSEKLAEKVQVQQWESVLPKESLEENAICSKTSAMKRKIEGPTGLQNPPRITINFFKGNGS
jgi:hypothetical protein